MPNPNDEQCPHGRWSWQQCDKCIANLGVLTVIPMSVEEALKAADSYSHLAINGSMVTVLAAEVRRLRQLMRGQTFVTQSDAGAEPTA